MSLRQLALLYVPLTYWFLICSFLAADMIASLFCSDSLFLCDSRSEFIDANTVAVVNGNCVSFVSTQPDEVPTVW